MKKKIKSSVGDVFAVPIDTSRFAVGQVVATYKDEAHYFAAFDAVAPSPRSIDLERDLERDLLFLILSFDAKLYVGDWEIVGRCPVSASIPFPAYKEMSGTSGRMEVVDYTGERRRLARSGEEDGLPYRDFIAPIRLEKALRSKFGLEPWLDAYSEMVPSNSIWTD